MPVGAVLAAGLLCALAPIVRPILAQPSILHDAEVRIRIKAGLDALYDMRFEEADAAFTVVSDRYEAHPVGPFLEALTTWWQILLDLSDTRYDEAFYSAMTNVIERSDQVLAQDRDNFDAIFFKGMALGFRGRLRSNRRDWLRAAADAKRAMDYVLAVADTDSTNHDYVFGSGLYHYYADIIPKRYPFARAITTFLPSGDREQGLAELTRTATQGYFLRTEATYFLLLIHYIYEQDFRACVDYVTWLRTEHPGNAFFHTLEGRVYARWGRWEVSETVFAEVLERYRSHAPGYKAAMAEQALYYLARARLEAGEPQVALSHLLPLEALAARIETDSYFKVLGRLLQGMAYDAMNRRDQAVARYEAVLSMQNWGTTHARARRYLNSPYTTDH